MPFIRSISGLRATIADALTDDIVINYCRAFAAMLLDGTIVVGRDGRPSGERIEKLIAKTLSENGRDVRIAGIVPTPTVQLLVEDTDAVGGIVITASHNPSEWNGLKFLGRDGVFLNKQQNEQLWEIVDNNKYPQNEKVGRIEIIEDALDIHIRKILNMPLLKKSLADIKQLHLTAVVDAVNASGSAFIPELLEKLGVKVIKLFCDNTGKFPHTPEPIPQNLTMLAEAVKENNADIGIAVDPDADRLVIIDNKGEAIGEEMTICLAVESVLSSLGRDSSGKNVVVNLSTTRLVEDITEKYDAGFYRSPVGEINVVNKMREVEAVIGGEGSGGVILPDCHYGRDSLVGLALIFSLMAEKGAGIRQLVNNLPDYKIVKYKKEFAGDINDLVERISKSFNDGKINLDDGIRIDYLKSWVQLRASNTEPIIRVIAEAPSVQEADDLANKLLNLI